eukprot:3925969-Heterocapsa_arctica.AAC.1
MPGLRRIMALGSTGCGISLAKESSWNPMMTPQDMRSGRRAPIALLTGLLGNRIPARRECLVTVST